MSIASLLQHNTVNEALTQSISIENIANSINFISDPPSEVFINQIFNVNLAVKIVGGSPLSSTDISCNVTKEFDLTKITTEIFTSLGNTNYNIQKTSLLAPSSKLDDDRTTDKTDENGIAKVYLRIKESPLNSKVVIVCQCGNVVSPPSSVISVLHSIRQITYNENYEETVKVEFSKNENEYLNTNVTLKSVIKINLMKQDNEQKVGTIKENDFTAVLVRKSEIEAVRKSGLKVTDVISTFNNVTTSNDIIEEITQFGNTLMRGVQTFSDIKKKNQNIGNVYFKIKLDEFKATISNISFIASKPDEYGLIFGLNGVYIDIHKESFFIKVEDNVSIIKSYFNISETVILIIFCFITLTFSSKMIKGYVLIFAILLTGLYIYLISIKNYATELYMISVFFFAGLVGIFLVWEFIIYFVDVWIKRKQPSYFYNKKEKYFIEYVYQRLNGHPSNYWVSRKLKVMMKTNDYYNLYTKSDKCNSRIEIKLEENDHSKGKSYDEVKDSLDDNFVQNKDSLLSDYNSNLRQNKKSGKFTKEELQSIPIDMESYKKLSFIRKTLRIFTPFEIMYRKIWIKDCFIYPQVLLTCIIICFFSIVYLGYNCLNTIINLSKSIESSYDKVYASSFSFIRNAVERYFSIFKHEAVESDLNPYYDQLKTFSDTVDQLVIAIKIGLFIGLVISVTIVFLNVLLILFDYKKRVLQARIGIYEFKREEISIQRCSGLPGAIVVNSLFFFFFFIFVITLLFSIIAWPMTWRVVWYFKWKLLSIISGTILNFVIKYIINRLCYNYDFVKRRTLLSIFDFILFQLAILAGIFSAITRFGVICMVLFLSIIRIDVNSAPEWFSNILYLDSFNKAYYASILVQHTHNNPIMITFCSLLMKITRNNKLNETKDGEEKRGTMIKKVRNKFNLWIFLTKNPSLIQYRVRVDSAEPNKAEIEEDITILHKNEESKNNSEESNNDIEENKDNIDSESDYEEFKRVESSSFEYRINPSDGSYSEKNI